MAFLIKPTALKQAQRNIYHNEAGFTAFPSTEQVAYNDQQLLPIGLLSYQAFDATSQQQILIAVPAVQGTFDGDYPYLSYSLTADGWQMDDTSVEFFGEEFSCYHDYFNQAQDFFGHHEMLTYSLEAEGSKQALFELGGQPPLGCNWDANLYDEMAENEELDHYFDVMDEEEGVEFETMSTREIVYLDEDTDQEYVYLGQFSYDTYLDGGGECIVFYQPELKKVLVVAEFS